MTELTITPKVADKTARFKGAVAAGEHVAVTIKGGAEWLGDDAGANLSLRVLDLVTGRTLAVFPYWTEDNSEDWPDDVTSADAWAPATDDSNDLYCELNLNTTRMVDAARHMLRVPVMFVLGDTGNPRTLYFRDRCEVEYWPERIGDTVPYDLDKWPKQIDEWAEQVAAWSTRLGAMKLSAVRTEAEDENPGKTTITLNDGTAETDTIVEILDGQVTPKQMNAAIAAMGNTKQDKLTFDAIPMEGSDNPVKSGGVYGAVKEVADAVTEHVGNTGIHVTAEQKTAWTAKYAKPQDGIPKSDLATSVQSSLGKADSAIQEHQSLAAYVNGGVYDGDAKKILLKHDSATVAEIDATAFIKDGMVDSVEITGGNLVISFNTDAGIEDIEIPLTDIFNPSNYYDKTAADNRFVQKEAGKGLVAVDAMLSTEGAAADAKAVGDVLDGKRGMANLSYAADDWFVTGAAEMRLVRDSSVQPPRGQWSATVAGETWVLLYTEAFWRFGTRGATAEDEESGADATSLTFDIDGNIYNLSKGSRLALINDVPQADSSSTPQMDSASGSAGGAQTTTYSKSDHSHPSDTSKQDALSKSQLAAVNSGVTSARVEKWDGYAAQIAQKANASDLPYRLVEPGKWEFSGSGVQSGVTYTVEIAGYAEDEYVYLIQADSILIATTPGTDPDPLEVTWNNVSTGGDIIATRASLPGHLCDRAGNRVVVSGDTTLTLPAAVPGHLRDFLVRLEISGSTVPTITFQGQGSEAPNGADEITYETDGDEFPVPDEAGTWSYSFTENCVAHKFAVSLKKVNTVAQGGA